jgi:hypothetical protein
VLYLYFKALCCSKSKFVMRTLGNAGFLRLYAGLLVCMCFTAQNQMVDLLHQHMLEELLSRLLTIMVLLNMLATIENS